jgi:GDP-4-dehydro-6-deoxy-D-mannose reductase
LKQLVTGGGGFAGPHLVRSLIDAGHAVVACGSEERPEGLPESAIWARLDVTDTQACWNLLEEHRPQVIYHLAAFAHVAQVEARPEQALRVNFGGTRNLLDACLDGFVQTRFLLTSSAEVYGRVSADELPVTEDHALRPGTAYALSKAAAEMAVHHAVARGADAVIARAFNHIGPGQSDDFVAAAFAHQIARIEAGEQEPVLQVGNLEARRDFSDVRDTVRGYQEVARVGAPGEAFNVTSGAAVSIRQLLDGLLRLSKAEIEVRVDPTRLRPIDVPVFNGSGEKLAARSGFAPQLDLKRTLGDVLDDWRARVSRALLR